jgi:hypothetical protein
MDVSANKTAARATLHCLTGCAIGEALGMVLGTALGWSNALTIAAAITLAFLFGYALSLRPLLKYGLDLSRALKLALAADTASIAVMELADNGFILLVPGAIHAGLDSALFWLSLGASLAVAFAAAFPLNKYLISRGQGHALAHRYHDQ